ncbi:MAG: serine--tRNA ligase [Candidatus Omnitrophota bacterium]
MLDIRMIRDNIEKVKQGVAAKNVEIDLDVLADLDKQRRDILTRAESLKAEQNRASDEIGQLLKNKQDASEKIAKVKDLKAEIESVSEPLKDIEEKIHQLMLTVPNLPHESVPIGGEENNEAVREWGEKPDFDFPPKTHMELAEDLDIIDFPRASKLSGSGFAMYKGMGARLERALFNFMLDLHTSQNGYREVFPPFVVNTESMTATGQLPKMAEDMYRCADDDLYLIPTAEVPVTNIHREEILDEDELPIRYTAYTACFRREAGSYGKDTRGLTRVHQFNKVELVKFVRPEGSYEELESLVENAEQVLKLLGLPYRVLILASGDLSFAAAKCYDLEAFSVGLDKWLEVSSCSNFEDFQARRANIRFKGKTQKKPAFVHTINGSGLALARTMIAILENYQTPDGEVVIPQVLRPYMDGAEKIGRRET